MAIIVVLAAIAIPTFGKQLETARESNDAEEIRAVVADAFTEAYMDFMKNGTVKPGETDVDYPKAVGSGTAGRSITFKQTVAGFTYLTPTFTVGGVTVEGTSTAVPAKNTAAQVVTVTFEDDATNGSIKLKDIKIDGTSIKKAN